MNQEELDIQKHQFLDARQQAYRRIFESDDGQYLLKDLAGFCRANATTYHDDSRLSDMLEGRREVWLRIQHHLKLTDDELWELYE
jgi:hypothetical protein